MNAEKELKLVVAITGASGAHYGIRALTLLQPAPIETHLILSAAAKITISQETDWKVSQVQELADFYYGPQDIGASIASGSFVTNGMLIAPCSIKTLSAVANSYANDLIARAADVCLKEGRPLLLMVRETPLHQGHLRLMSQAAEAGAVLFPPVPAFYDRPKTIDDLVTSSVGRALLRMGLPVGGFTSWQGLSSS